MNVPDYAKFIFINIQLALQPVEAMQAGDVFGKTAVANLNKICAETKARLVLIGQWRKQGLSMPRYLLKGAGFEGVIQDKTPNFGKGFMFREDECLEWIKARQGSEFTLNGYCVFDEVGCWSQLRNNLIPTDPKMGINEKMTKQAIELLMDGMIKTDPPIRLGA